MKHIIYYNSVFYNSVEEMPIEKLKENIKNCKDLLKYDKCSLPSTKQFRRIYFTDNLLKYQNELKRRNIK